MTLNVLKRDERRGRIPREFLSAARTSVKRATGLTIDMQRLDGSEQAELVTLTQRIAKTAERGVIRDDPRYLDDRGRARYEQLAERAAGKPDGYFQQQRKEQALREKLAELAVKARRPSARPRWEEEGAVVLPREVFEHVRDGILYAEHVNLLVLLLQQFENAVTFIRTSRFEGSGDDLVLVVDSTMGVVGDQFSEEGLPRWKQHLEHLEANSYFTVDRSGREWRIRLGPRAIAATKGRSACT